MDPIEPYPNVPPATAPQDPVARSVSRESAFTKPGTTTKGKGWQPAKGVRFRPTNEKGKIRKRKLKPDPRRVQFY